MLCFGVFFLASCGTNVGRLGFKTGDFKTGEHGEGDEDEDTQGRTIAVFCPGFAADAESLAAIEKGVLVELNSNVESVPNEADTQAGIQTQGENLATFLIKEKRITPNDSVVLIGHSQGGLRAFVAAQQLKALGYNVVGVVTVGTPWRGGHVLLKENLDKLPLLIKGIVETFIKDKDLETQGIKDMVPHSQFLNKIAEDLKSVDTPMLLIGGNVQGTKVIDLVSGFFGQINEAVSNSPHTKSMLPCDLVFPLKSQLAIDIKNGNIQRRGFIKTMHFPNPFCSSELDNQELIKHIQHFIEQQLKASE